MRSSRHVILFGVGALITLGSVAPGAAEAVSQPQQPSDRTDQAESAGYTEQPSSPSQVRPEQNPAFLVQTKPANLLVETSHDRSLAAVPSIDTQPEPKLRAAKLQRQAPAIEPAPIEVSTPQSGTIAAQSSSAQPVTSPAPIAPSPLSSAKPQPGPAQPSTKFTLPARTVSNRVVPNQRQRVVPTAQVQPDASPSQTPVTPSPPASPFNVAPTAPAPTVQPPLPPGTGRLTPFPYPSLPLEIPIPPLPTDPLPPVQDPPRIGPAPAGRAPESLNPAPNPLQFPTRPEEVRLRGIQPITLLQAIELAERNSPTLQTQLNTLRRRQLELQEQRAANFPDLNFQSALSNSRTAGAALNAAGQQLATPAAPPFGPAPPQRQDADEPDPRASSALTGTLTLSYDLFTSGRRPALIRAAERQLRVEELQLEVTREDLRLNVARAYYSLQQGDESVRINLAAVRNAETSLRDAQALERAGLGTRFDVLRAEVQLANARQDLTESLAQQEIRRRQLAQLLNLPLTISLAAGDPVSLAGSWDLSLEQSLILALKNRAELEQLLAQRELSEQQRRAALSAYGPTVTLSASYEFATQFNDDLGTRDGYRLAAGVNWNLFDGGAALAQARQQEANIAIAETNFTNQRNQIRFEVEQAYYTLVSNLESIDTATRALAQANEALRLARLRFQAGVGTQTDVINAETELTRAEGNRVNAILGYNQALAELQRAISNFRVAPVAGTPIAPTTPTVPPTVPEAAPTPPETPVPTTPEATPAVPTTPAPTPAVPTTPEPTPATPTAPEAVPAVPETPVPTTPEPTPGTPEPTTPPVPAPEPTP